MSLGATVKKAYHRSMAFMFMSIGDYTGHEIDAMPEKVYAIHRRVYDIYFYLVMFWAFTYAGARVYETISFTALGFIPPNLIQVSPVYLMWVIMAFMIFAVNTTEKAERLSYHGIGDIGQKGV